MAPSIKRMEQTEFISFLGLPYQSITNWVAYTEIYSLTVLKVRSKNQGFNKVDFFGGVLREVCSMPLS